MIFFALRKSRVLRALAYLISFIIIKSTGKGGSGVPNVVATAPMVPLASGGVKGLGTTCADHGNASVHIPHVLGPFH